MIFVSSIVLCAASCAAATMKSLTLRPCNSAARFLSFQVILIVRHFTGQNQGDLEASCESRRHEGFRKALATHLRPGSTDVGQWGLGQWGQTDLLVITEAELSLESLEV